MYILQHTLPLFIKLKINSLILDSRFSEIFKGSLWSLSAQVLGAGLSIVFNIIIARFFGAEVIGIIAVLNSFLIISTIFTVFGTGTSILRLIPEHIVKYSPTSAFRMYRKTQLLIVAFSIVTSAVLFIFSGAIAGKVFEKTYLSFYFSLAAFFIVFRSLMTLNTQAVRGLRLVKIFAFMQVLPRISRIILLILLAMFSFSSDAPVFAYIGGFAVTGIVGLIIMDVEFKRRMRPEDQIHTTSVKTILSISVPMLMNSTMFFIMAQTGIIMLGMFRNDEEVGYFGIAVKLATLTTFVLSAINSMAAPKFSEYYHSGEMDKLFYIAKKSAKLIFWTTTPILLVLLFFGKPILALLFGPKFVAAYSAMVFLVIGQFVNAVSGSTGYFMNMTGHQNAFRNILSIAVIVNLTMNYLLIPKYGIGAAAIVSMSSGVLWNLITIFYLKYKFGKTTCYLPFL